jgi:hypothetical protein
MSKQDRQKLSILGVLLGVLALTLVLGYRLNQPATTAEGAGTQAPETKTSVNPPAPSNARIRIDLVEKPEADQDIGKRNVFEYHQAPPPPPPQRGPSFPGPSQPASPGLSPINPRPSGPPPNLGPPPMPLKYQGYLVLDTPTGGFTAVIADDSRHYNVTVGEVLMGRYRILAISDKVVDVEDMEYNRRQSLPIAK